MRCVFLCRAVTVAFAAGCLAAAEAAWAWDPDGPQSSSPEFDASIGRDALHEAENALRNRNFEAAIRAASSAMRGRRLPAPQLALAYRVRGMAHLNLRRADQARADFGSSLAIEPSDVVSLVGRGAALSALGRTADAVADFDRALAQKRDPAIYYWRGMAFLKLANLGAAAADFEEALSLNPRYVPALYGRGLVHHALGQNTRARDDYERALSIDRTHPGARDALRALQARRAAPIEQTTPAPTRNSVVQF